jgi:uncharacterized protein (TIGR02246 family)
VTLRLPLLEETLEKAMDEQTLRCVERLMTLFGRYADCGDSERLASLFLPDGTLSLGSVVSTGRSAIASFSKERSSTPGRKTRHLWSNLELRAGDHDTLHASAIQQTYELIPATQSTQLRISDLEDVFAKDADGSWRFASRRIARQVSVNMGMEP